MTAPFSHLSRVKCPDPAPSRPDRPRLTTGIGLRVCPTAVPISKGTVAYTKPKVADGDAIGPPLGLHVTMR